MPMHGWSGAIRSSSGSLLLPVGLALLLRVLIPRAHDALLVSTGFDLAPYYPLVMGGYLMTAPGIVGMVIGFLLLDERDAHTLTALRVTPLSMRRYLAYRVTVPLLLGDRVDPPGLFDDRDHIRSRSAPCSRSRSWPRPLGAFVGPGARDRAPNKVAGLAVVKVLNGVNLLPIAAFFLPIPLQYVAGVIPTYWPMRAFWSAAKHEEYLAYLAVGAIMGALTLVLTASMFERKLLRHG